MRPRHTLRPRHSLLAALSLAVACSSPSGGGTTSLPPRPVPVQQMAVHRVYTASFAAIQASLEADDLGVARATIRQLRGRLAADRQTAPTMAQARQRDDDIAVRTLSGELPSRESVDAAIAMAEGFERIVEGRLRMKAVTLSVDLVRIPDTEEIEVRLVGSSNWDFPLSIRPSAVSLVTERVWLEPRTGQERTSSSRGALPDVPALTLPGLGESTVAIAMIPIQVPVGAIATRTRVALDCNGGVVQQGSDVYPAQDIAVAVGERTDIAGFIPASIVDPIELVELVERGNAPLPRMLECAVRIAPARRPETLDRLGYAVQTLPEESMRTLVPALRWLTGTNEFGRDERAWRTWLIERYEDRRSTGQVTSFEKR